MNDIIIKDNEKIEDMIYEIRGKQVMLDYDLARVYECTNGTKDINKAVKRNIERFPNDFYFQLFDSEFENLRFQFGTSKILFLHLLIESENLLGNALHFFAQLCSSFWFQFDTISPSHYLA